MSNNVHLVSRKYFYGRLLWIEMLAEKGGLSGKMGVEQSPLAFSLSRIRGLFHISQELLQVGSQGRQNVGRISWSQSASKSDGQSPHIGCLIVQSDEQSSQTASLKTIDLCRTLFLSRSNALD